MWIYSNWKSKHFLKTGSHPINTNMLFLELVSDTGWKQKLWLTTSSHRKKTYNQPTNNNRKTTSKKTPRLGYNNQTHWGLPVSEMSVVETKLRGVGKMVKMMLWMPCEPPPASLPTSQWWEHSCPTQQSRITWFLASTSLHKVQKVCLSTSQP